MRVTLNAHTGWSLQRRCEADGCGHRQRVTVRDLFTVMAKVNYGGTRKEAAFKCARCSAHNVLMRQFLPRGVFEILPNLQAFESTPAPAKIVPSAPVPVTIPAVKPKAVQAASPDPAPVTRPQAAGQPAATPPEWLTGKAAFLALCRDLNRSILEEGDIAALGRSKEGALIPLNLDFRSVSAEALLAFLDQNTVELLVIGGVNADGSRWKTIFHPHAGMASMVTEPI